MNYHFRKAEISDIDAIETILQQAILRRKKDGSDQWQDGYPNPEIIQKDIEKGAGFVLTEGETILGYSAVLINDEPAYADIEGKWLTDADFVVFHRVAISEKYLGNGLSQIMIEHIENFARNNSIYSLKVDTNFDNLAMMKILDKSGFIYCGEVYFRGSSRRAYEKILDKNLNKSN